MADDDVLSFLMSEIGRVPGRNPKALETCQAIMTETAGKGATVDPLLITALIYIESAYNPSAVSKVGARGLMQLMPATAEEVAKHTGVSYSGPADLFDPVINVTLGIRYLLQLYTMYKGHWPVALTAYNRGPGNVRKILEAHEGLLPPIILASYSDLILRKYYSFVKRFPAQLV